MYSSIAIIPKKREHASQSLSNPCEGWKSWSLWRCTSSKGCLVSCQVLVIESEGIDILWQFIDAKMHYIIPDCEWEELVNISYIIYLLVSGHIIMSDSLLSGTNPWSPQAESAQNEHPQLNAINFQLSKDQQESHILPETPPENRLAPRRWYFQASIFRCLVSFCWMYRKTTEIPPTFSKGHKEMSFATRLGGMWLACDDETSILSHVGRRNQRLFEVLKRWNFSRSLVHGTFRVPPIPTPPANKEGLIAPWFLKNA